MDSLKLEVYCPSCCNAHQYHDSVFLMNGGHSTIYIQCPYCGAQFKVIYGVRRIQTAGADYPAVMPMER